MDESKGAFTGSSKSTPQPLVGGDGSLVRVEWPDFRRRRRVRIAQMKPNIEDQSLRTGGALSAPLAPSRIGESREMTPDLRSPGRQREPTCIAVREIGG